MAKDQKKLDKASDAARQREKERRRDFKKGVDKALRLSDFSTKTKREWNKSHRNKI